MICFRAETIRCESPMTDYQELNEIVEKSGAQELDIGLDNNSPDTILSVIKQGVFTV